jgi:hypothetical protein
MYDIELEKLYGSYLFPIYNHAINARKSWKKNEFATITSSSNRNNEQFIGRIFLIL